MVNILLKDSIALVEMEKQNWPERKVLVFLTNGQMDVTASPSILCGGC
jgi:hypothetical protein